MVGHSAWPARRIAKFLSLAAAVTLGLGLASAHAAERFVLDVPGDASLRSEAVRDGNSLIITDAGGNSFVYVRNPRFDSPDGRFAGYFSRAANQAMRWPVNDVGQFQIGDPLGAQFRVSRMTITPIAPPVVRNTRKPVAPPPALDPNFRDPVLPGPNGNRLPGVGGPQFPGVRPGLPGGDAVVNDRFPRPRPRGNPTEVSLVEGPGETLYAAYVDADGLVQLYSGWLDRWQRRTVPLRRPLMPGASLTLVPNGRRDLPTIYTIGSRGELLEIVNGDLARSLTDNATFPSGTHLVTGGSRHFRTLDVVDDRGRIWEIGLDRGQSTAIEQRADRYPAGAPLATVDFGGDEELFVIDRLGTLVNYRKVRGRWEGPDAIARGFTPGGHVATMILPAGVDSSVVVGSVDSLGRLQCFRLTATGWTPLPLGEILLPPGSSVGMVRAADGIHVSGVMRDGRWIDWSQQTIGNLVPREIGRGFPAGAPIVFAAHDDHLHAVCVDSLGRMIAATSHDNQWSSVLCVPEFDLAPRLVRRVVQPGVALPDVTVQFSNTSQEEIFVKVFDELGPSAPLELRIPPGRAVQQALKRDPAGVIEEVWLVPGPGGRFVEDVRRSAIPSPPRYRVVAYANRTTYSYVDRRAKPGPLKDFDLQTPVSLGTFRLPPGVDLRDGDSFDVVREATMRNNPGAAAIIDPRGP